MGERTARLIKVGDIKLLYISADLWPGPHAQAPGDVNSDAIALARETLFSYGDCCRLLDRVGDRPDRVAVARIVCEIACRHALSLDYTAWVMLGDETTPGVLNAGRKER